MSFISFVLSLPRSRTSPGDRSEPFSSPKGEGLALGTKEESARHFPIPTIRFCSFHFFVFPCHWRSTSIPWDGGTRASIGVMKSEAIGAATFLTEARHPFAPPEGNAAFDAGKEAITGKQYRGTDRWCQKASQLRIGKLWKGEERCRPTSGWSTGRTRGSGM